MERIKNLSSLLVIIFVQTCLLFAQKPIDKYEFPLNPGMAEWKTLPVEEKNKLLQIPNEKLMILPTETLIQAYIDNPFSSLIFAYDNVQDGFHRVHTEFNGLRELLNRSDAAIKLIEFYKKMQPGSYDLNWEQDKKGEFTFKFLYIEILLSQPQIINQLKIIGNKDIINELIEKLNEKAKYINEHSIVGLESCTYALAKIITQNTELTSTKLIIDNEMQLFLDTGHFCNSHIQNEILKKAKEQLQN